jgi:thiol-disulfide isomerase/thioredoxin
MGKRIWIQSGSIFLNNNFYSPNLTLAGIKDNGISKMESNSPEVLIISTLYSTLRHVFVSPGDSIAFKILPNTKQNGFLIESYGKNAAHYNYLEYRDRDMGNVKYFKQGGDIHEYRSMITEWKKKRVEFLEAYRKQYPVSPEFIKWAEADIEYEFIFLLYFPVSSGEITFEKLPAGYIPGDIKLAENEYPSRYFSSGSGLYILFYGGNLFNYAPSIVASDIVKKYDGYLRSYLLSVMFGEYANKLSLNYLTDFLSTIENTKSYIQDSIHSDYIKKGMDYITAVTNTFPDSVLLNTRLVSSENKKEMLLKDVLDKYKGRPLYFDFWASWCGPCLGDIENSKEVKEFFVKKGVEYLYFSIDAKESDWKNKTEEYGIGKNQYLILDAKNSPLTKYLNIKLIPKYIFFNNKHDIVDFEAPSPVSKNLETLKSLIEKSSAVELKVQY